MSNGRKETSGSEKGRTGTLPRIPVIEEFLRQLSILPGPKDPDWVPFDVVPARRQGLGRRIVESPALQAWHRRDGEFGIESMIRRLREALAKGRHVDSEEMAAVFLGLYCITDPEERDPVAHMNHLLALIEDARVEEHYVSVIPPYPGSQPYSIGSFELAAVDREKLRYRCERVGCNFFDLYPDALRSGLAISRRRNPCKAIHVPQLRRARDLMDLSLWQTIVDHYFDALTKVLRQQFLTDFREAQEVLVSAGAPYFDTTEPFVWGNAMFVAIYEYDGQRGGYFCPFNQQMGIGFAKADERFPSVARRLKEAFGFDGELRGEIGAVLRAFCRFVTRATNHRIQGNVDEAFLHNVIALDLVFGERNAVNENVTRRAAAVVGPGLSLDHDKAEALVDRLYDLRSRYVHEGRAIPEEETVVLEGVVREVLSVLLRVHARSSVSAPRVGKGEWLRDVDRLVFTHKAGKLPTDDDLGAVGLRP